MTKSTLTAPSGPTKMPKSTTIHGIVRQRRRPPRGRRLRLGRPRRVRRDLASPDRRVGPACVGRRDDREAVGRLLRRRLDGYSCRAVFGFHVLLLVARRTPGIFHHPADVIVRAETATAASRGGGGRCGARLPRSGKPSRAIYSAGRSERPITSDPARPPRGAQSAHPDAPPSHVPGPCPSYGGGGHGAR